jgi:ubiquinone/menaquinone biosynthesis C-methylase UbiE
LGYEVHLLDLSERLVEIAQVHAERLPRESPGSAIPSSIQAGDARQLPYEDSSADAVLMLGPLYHLPERDDRRTALTEAARVSKPGAPLFAAGISRFASLLDGLVSGTFALESFREIIGNDLGDGHHVNPIEDIRFFTDSYFHHPDELGAEIAESGFELESVLPVEGLAAGVSDLESLWKDEAQRESLLDLLERLEGEASLAGSTFHLLAVAYRR